MRVGRVTAHPSLRRRVAAVLLLALVVLLPGIGSSVAAMQVVTPRPNIIVFYLDDTSPHDGRLWSNANRTPTLKNYFVDNGVEFKNAIGETPLCCPGRASLLTGLHTHHHGVFRNRPHTFKPGENVAEALQRSGYATMWVGKYLNRVDSFSEADWNRHENGWTWFDALDTYNAKFFNYSLHTKTGNISYGQKHSTRMAAERTALHIEQTPAEKPVFGVVSISNTHAPNTPMQQYRDDPRCDNIQPWNPPNYNEADISDKPSYYNQAPLQPYQNGWPMRTYCREMLGVDWAVAHVISALQREGRLDNTMLVFTADNGMTWGQHRRGQHKLTIYSTPVPLYIWWPSHLGNGSRGRVINDVVSNIDLAPTFCDIAGCTLGPYPTGQDEPDGLSMLPLLESGAANPSLGRDAVLEQSHYWRAIRTTSASPLGRWHYAEYDSGERELYDSVNDPWEMENVAGKPAYAEVQQQLRQRLHQLLNN
jgi:arylsulfatase A-like enzyme